MYTSRIVVAYADEVDGFMHLYLHIQDMYRVLQYVQGNIHITAGLVLRANTFVLL
jgi:hypothetical protein